MCQVSTPVILVSNFSLVFKRTVTSPKMFYCCYFYIFVVSLFGKGFVVSLWAVMDKETRHLVAIVGDRRQRDSDASYTRLLWRRLKQRKLGGGGM